MPVVDYQTLSRGSTPGALVEYVSDARKAAAVRFRNLLPDLTLAEAFFGASVDRANVNAKPLAHIAISWPADEQPSIDEAFAYGEKFLDRMGFTGQSALLAAHDDATHRHIHIMLDRVGANGRVLAQERIAGRLVEVRDELAREFGFAELGSNIIPTSNKIETAKAFNGRFTFTEFAREKLRRSRPSGYQAYDDQLWDLFGATRFPDKTGHYIVYQGATKTYYAKASAIGFGPRRVKTWGPQPPALDVSPDRTPNDTYDAFLEREESLTPFAKAHPRRLEFERARRNGVHVGQLGRFLRTPSPEPTMTDIVSDLTIDEQNAVAELAAQMAPPPTTPHADANTVGPAGGPIPEAVITENSIGGPTAKTAKPQTPPTTLRDLYRSFLTTRGASEERVATLVDDAQQLIQLRRGALREGLGLTHLARDRDKFVDSLRELGTFSRSAHLRHDLAAYYAGQDYIGIDAFASLATTQLRTAPETLAQSLASRASIYGLDPSLAAMAVLADLHATRNDESGNWLYRVNGSGQTFEERADRRYYFDEKFDVRDTRTIDASLLAAAALHGGRVEITGDRAFVENAVRRAVELGIEVTNHRELFNQTVEQVRARQTALLAKREGVHDPLVLAAIAAGSLASGSTSLRDDRTNHPERTPYRVEAVIDWNNKSWLLLRDVTADRRDARSSVYLFGEQPAINAQIPNGIKAGDVVAIEGQGDAIAITEHVPDAKREQEEARKNQQRVEEIVREERAREGHTR